MFRFIKPTATLLLIFGGLNWGFVGLFGMDVIAQMFGTATMPARLVYIVITSSAFVVLGSLFRSGHVFTQATITSRQLSTV